MPDPQLRAADADREAVAGTLGRALSDGRLTVDEYEERLAKAYAARTYADLDALTTDLPRPAAPRPSAPPPAARAPHRTRDASPSPWSRGALRAVWGSWLTVSLVVTAIWLATSVGNGHPDHFWPVWVILPWGAVLLARTVTGGPHPQQPHHHDRYRRCR